MLNMFKPISQDQFKVAQDTLEKIRRLLAIRDHLIEQGRLQAELVLPGIMWKPITLFSYALNPTYEIVNTWRLHTYPFTGHYLGYAIDNGHNPMPASLMKKYHKLTDGLPTEMIARPPRILGEIGWEVNGGVVNKDVLMYQNHITNLYFSGALDFLRSKKSLRILEIGGGYGGLAYFLWKILKPSAFYLVDLVESLAFSSVYLTLTGNLDGVKGSVYNDGKSEMLDAPKNGFVFLPNFLIDDLSKTDKFDFVINTGSFGEMTEQQVVQYADIIHNVLADDGIILEDNGDIVPVSNIFAQRFKRKILYKTKRLWAKNEEVLAKVAENAKPQQHAPKTARQWLVSGLKHFKR
jgi:hypothetical protein